MQSEVEFGSKTYAQAFTKSPRRVPQVPGVFFPSADVDRPQKLGQAKTSLDTFPKQNKHAGTRVDVRGLCGCTHVAFMKTLL